MFQQADAYASGESRTLGLQVGETIAALQNLQLAKTRKILQQLERGFLCEVSALWRKLWVHYLQ